MIEVMKLAVKRSPLAYAYIYVKSFLARPRSQNDEEVIIERLLSRYSVPKTFIEFGFSGWEFNCAALANDWHGLLVDGDRYNIKIARTIFKKNITVKHLWITMETLGEIEEWADGLDLGILSVDVDGNDYWFLERLIHLRPAIIISEYNSSFGLKPVTVPYDGNFDRTKKHESHTYYGASLSALNHVAVKEAYSLIEVGNTGVNAFFVRNDLLTKDDLILQPEYAFREKLFSDGTRQSAQWKKIMHLPYVDVTDY